MLQFVSYYHAPIGWLQLQSTSEHLVSLHFTEPDVLGSPLPATAFLQQCHQQLDEYFEGHRKTFDIPTLQSGTVFQQIVWNALRTIPFGKTISYLSLARQIGDAKATRAVAAANGKNKLAIIIPCHRVIGSKAQLIGYSGSVWRKKWLLDHEAKHFSGVQSFNF